MAVFNVHLRDPSLLVGLNYIDGKWVEAESQKRFDVTSEQTVHSRNFQWVLASVTDHLVGWSQTLPMGTSSDLVQNRTRRMRKRRLMLQQRPCLHGALCLVATVVASYVGGMSWSWRTKRTWPHSSPWKTEKPSLMPWVRFCLPLAFSSGSQRRLRDSTAMLFLIANPTFESPF
jgi:hypothetical protein